MNHFLFLYGPLLKGGRYFESHLARCRALGPATVTGRLLYLEEPGFAALVPDGEDKVAGGLFEVSEEELVSLDYLFGYAPGKPDASEFVRRHVSARAIKGDFDAESYFLRAETLRKRFPEALEIPGGNWDAFARRLSPLPQYEEEPEES